MVTSHTVQSTGAHLLVHGVIAAHDVLIDRLHLVLAHETQFTTAVRRWLDAWGETGAEHQVGHTGDIEIY